MNSVSISGTLGRDPETHVLASGMMKIEFSVANKVWTKAGIKTVWINCRAIGKRAEAAAAHLRKGSKVWVSGAWYQDEWVDRATQAKRRADYLFAATIEWDGAKVGGPGDTRDDPSEQQPQENGFQFSEEPY